jgi:hypothetical protein
MNVWSNAGRALGMNVLSPRYVDIGPFLEYSIFLYNYTANDITAGELTIQCAHAKADDPCEPDVWADLDAIPECTAAPGTVAGPAKIVLSATHPIKAKTGCWYAAPCPCQFLRVTGSVTGLDVTAVLTRPRRSITAYGTKEAGIFPPPVPGYQGFRAGQVGVDGRPL